MMSKHKKKHPHRSQQPHWQLISMSPTAGPHITGMLETAEEQYVNLQQARPKPYILDNFTVSRVIQVFGKQKKDGRFTRQAYQHLIERARTIVQSLSFGHRTYVLHLRCPYTTQS